MFSPDAPPPQGVHSSAVALTSLSGDFRMVQPGAPDGTLLRGDNQMEDVLFAAFLLKDRWLLGRAKRMFGAPCSDAPDSRSMNSNSVRSREFSLKGQINFNDVVGDITSCVSLDEFHPQMLSRWSGKPAFERDFFECFDLGSLLVGPVPNLCNRKVFLYCMIWLDIVLGQKSCCTPVQIDVERCRRCWKQLREGLSSSGDDGLLTFYLTVGHEFHTLPKAVVPPRSVLPHLSEFVDLLLEHNVFIVPAANPTGVQFDSVTI